MALKPIRIVDLDEAGRQIAAPSTGCSNGRRDIFELARKGFGRPGRSPGQQHFGIERPSGEMEASCRALRRFVERRKEISEELGAVDQRAHEVSARVA